MALSLDIKDLTAGYGKTPVLKNIHLSMEKGNICALMGRNGSGKTTLLRCINAILSPTQGTVKIMGEDVFQLNRMEIAKIISVVPQGNHTAFPFTCLEMILMGSVTRLKPWKMPGKQEKAQALSSLEEIGIADLATRPFNRLSGGERQLVMLARALYQNTPLMLLDEPNTHLDFSNQHHIMALVRKIVKKRNVTALITLHDPNLALYYCDSLIMLKNGERIAHGETGNVMTNALLRNVLGDNIQCDATVNGLRVVTPRQGFMKTDNFSDDRLFNAGGMK